MSNRPISFILTAAALALFALPAAANERHLTYTYETGVLAPDAKEIEVWTTARLGRDDFYTRFEERLEFEVGLTDNLQTALYLNFRTTIQDTPDGRSEKNQFRGISSEWKLKLTDPVADALGFALYGEVSAKPDEVELEAKLLFDKRIGDVLFALNLIYEHEAKFKEGGDESELIAEGTFGTAYFLSKNLSIGLEARTRLAAPNYGDIEYWALWAGPTVAYTSSGWWTAISVLPQLPALSHEGDGALDLDHNEKVLARLLLAFEL